jgi:hypothetical protein
MRIGVRRKRAFARAIQERRAFALRRDDAAIPFLFFRAGAGRTESCLPDKTGSPPENRSAPDRKVIPAEQRGGFPTHE